MPLERLQKIIAKAGVSSRREAEEYIRAGRVTVNGKVVTELGTRADPKRDHVKVDGKLIHQEEQHRYILMNKPREVMTTTADPEGRRTVLDLLRGVRERLFPVGRLDYHSEGLILLTNDGDLAFRVSHPSSGSIKTYHVKVRGIPPAAVIDKLSRGVVLDGKRTLPCEIGPLRTTGKTSDEGNSWWEVKLREGRTNQIRRMFQYQGFPVSKLRRVAIGGLSDAKLATGEWRELDDREIRRLLDEPPARRAPRARRTTSSSGRAGATKGGSRTKGTSKTTTGKRPAGSARGSSAKKKASSGRSEDRPTRARSSRSSGSAATKSGRPAAGRSPSRGTTATRSSKGGAKGGAKAGSRTRSTTSRDSRGTRSSRPAGKGRRS